MSKQDVELLTQEYVEEVLAAGGAKLMSASDLGQFISELVLNNFSKAERAALQDFALQTAHMFLLPEECRKRGIEVDAETLELLAKSLL